MHQLELPYSPYLKDKSLLFQFILNQYLLAAPLVENLGSKPVTAKTSDKIKESLFHLLGHPKSFVLSEPKKNTLYKLPLYALYFASLDESNETKLLSEEAEKLWNSLRSALESFPSNEEVSKHLKKALFLKDKIGKRLALLIPCFEDDENVLYFMLRNSKRFDISFKKRFVKGMLESLQSSHDFLAHRFSKRGFNHLLPVISHYVMSL